jgi:Tfp pilus assembly major pilin PilA
MIPLEELLGASLLTLAAIALITLSTAALSYVRNATKKQELEAATAKIEATNTAALIAMQRDLIAVQKSQHKLMRHIAIKTNTIDKRTNTNIRVLRQVVAQLEALTQEQKMHNGNTKKLHTLIANLKHYLERRE